MTALALGAREKEGMLRMFSSVFILLKLSTYGLLHCYFVVGAASPFLSFFLSFFSISTVSERKQRKTLKPFNLDNPPFD
jgi:hypothetical protein